MSGLRCPACAAPVDLRTVGLDGYVHCLCQLIWTSPELRAALAREAPADPEPRCDCGAQLARSWRATPGPR